MTPELKEAFRDLINSARRLKRSLPKWQSDKNPETRKKLKLDAMAFNDAVKMIMASCKGAK